MCAVLSLQLTKATLVHAHTHECWHTALLWVLRADFLRCVVDCTSVVRMYQNFEHMVWICRVSGARCTNWRKVCNTFEFVLIWILWERCDGGRTSTQRRICYDYACLFYHLSFLSPLPRSDLTLHHNHLCVLWFFDAFSARDLKMCWILCASSLRKRKF